MITFMKTFRTLLVWTMKFQELIVKRNCVGCFMVKLDFVCISPREI